MVRPIRSVWPTFMMPIFHLPGPRSTKQRYRQKALPCLLDLLQKQGFYNVYACITANNQRSIDFHAAFGFRNLGPHPKAGYKFDQWLDIIWMDKQLQQPDGSPRPLKPISAFNNNDILNFSKK